jgi:pimeloyl-ACP methyl ester carboxylesterase
VNVDYRFVQTRGLRFEVATAGEGDRLALLLHGFPECAYSWRHQLPLFARLGYRTWAPNLRGYGRTDRPAGVAAYAIDRLEQDVAALIDASGARTITLVGHDWGGGIAWSVAMRRRRPLERLVIMNAPHPACFVRSLRSPRQLRRSAYILLIQVPWWPERFLRARGYERIGRIFRDLAVDKTRFPDEVIDVFKRNAAYPGALTAMLNYYRAMPLAAPAAFSRRLPTIDVPTLMIWGEMDLALGKELIEGTEEFVSDLPLRRLPTVSHWVQQEAPEAVNGILETWLAGR